MHLLLVRHRLALILALTIGALYVSHHVFIGKILSDRGEVYTPITVASSRDEGAYYALRAHAAYKGDLIVGDVNVYEYKDTPAYLPIGNPLIMAGVGRLAGSLERGFIFADFLFPALIFLIIYAIAYECVRSRLGSLLFASIFLIVPKFALFPSAGALPSLDIPSELYFSRFEYPEITFFFFGLAIYTILRTFRGEKWMPFAAGASFGLLFYTYLYDWVYVGSALLLVTFLFLFERNWIQLRRVGAIFCMAALISVPYWINLFMVVHLPSYSDLLVRIGTEVGAQLRIEIVWPSYVRAAVLALTTWFLLGKERHLLRVLLVSLLLPIFVLLNLQIVTGVMPQPDHWHRTQFLALALAVFVISHHVTRSILARAPPRLIRSIVLIGVSIFLLFGAWSQYSLSQVRSGEHTLDPSYAHAYAWLREHDPHAVVATLDSTTNHELVMHADSLLFVPSGLNTIAPTEEIWNRVTLLTRLLGMSYQDFSRYVNSEETYLFTDTYLDHSFNSYFRTEKREIPTSVLNQRISRLESLKREKFFIIPYRLDYILIGPRENARFADANALKNLPYEVVFKSDEVTLYRYHE